MKEDGPCHHAYRWPDLPLGLSRRRPAKTKTLFLRSSRCECMTIKTIIVIILGLSALPCFSQQAVTCNAPLSEDQLLVLVRGHVPVARVREYIVTCGIADKIGTAGIERLRSAGASEAVLELLANTKSAANTREEMKVKAELELWDAVKNTRDPALYQEYLRQYPQGTFAAVARARINEITSPPASDTAPSSAAGVSDTPRMEGINKKGGDAAIVGIESVRKELSAGVWAVHHHGGIWRMFNECEGRLVISPSGISFVGTPGFQDKRVQHKLNASWGQVKSVEVCGENSLCIKGGGDSLKLELVVSFRGFEFVPQVVNEYRR